MNTISLINHFLLGDWKLIWNDSGIHTSKFSTDSFSYCHYLIFYSRKKNRYVLEVEGYEPKNHEKYTTALAKLTELNNSLLISSLQK